MELFLSFLYDLGPPEKLFSRAFNDFAELIGGLKSVFLSRSCMGGHSDTPLKRRDGPFPEVMLLVFGILKHNLFFYCSRKPGRLDEICGPYETNSEVLLVLYVD